MQRLGSELGFRPGSHGTSFHVPILMSDYYTLSPSERFPRPPGECVIAGPDVEFPLNLVTKKIR